MVDTVIARCSSLLLLTLDKKPLLSHMGFEPTMLTADMMHYQYTTRGQEYSTFNITLNSLHTHKPPCMCYTDYKLMSQSLAQPRLQPRSQRKRPKLRPPTATAIIPATYFRKKIKIKYISTVSFWGLCRNKREGSSISELSCFFLSFSYNNRFISLHKMCF